MQTVKENAHVGEDKFYVHLPTLIKTLPYFSYNHLSIVSINAMNNAPNATEFR